jgi:DNA-nicking Smr family endonuclease
MGGPKHKIDETDLRFNPFKALKKLKDTLPPPSPPPKKEPEKKPFEAERHLTDEQLLEAAMAGVQPVDAPALVPKQARARPMLAESDDDALVMQELDELIHGDGDFDFADTDEFIEACRADLDRRTLKKLRRGDYSFQAFIDLHGMNRQEARVAVGVFIKKSFLESKKCVLIVHGRGLGSRDNIPVIKNKLAAWLTRGSIGKRVLAYTSSLPHDGGTGAVYVLLSSP